MANEIWGECNTTEGGGGSGWLGVVEWDLFFQLPCNPQQHPLLVCTLTSFCPLIIQNGGSTNSANTWINRGLNKLPFL